MLGFVARQRQRDGEAPGAADARHRGKVRAPEAPARREQGDRLEQIGLAGPVLADERDEAPADREIEFRMVAEVARDQPAQALSARREVCLGIRPGRDRRSLGPAHTRIGIRT
ncbi:hypothetical protein AEGHOMDF_3484 [Methylobacterium soli]|nr:hypothetical protein AEGHOMDF_3484 [Methylobacterium soli]